MNPLTNQIYTLIRLSLLLACLAVAAVAQTIPLGSYTAGGRAATVLYAGRAPGFGGLNQLNLTLPAGLAAGSYSLVVTRGGVASNSVTIAIK